MHTNRRDVAENRRRRASFRASPKRPVQKRDAEPPDLKKAHSTCTMHERSNLLRKPFPACSRRSSTAALTSLKTT